MSFVVGTSLVDGSDPRLDHNRACYEKVVDYYPLGATVEREEALRRERALYFDVCNRIAAYSQRLALRAGIGILTDSDPEDPDTRAELFAGALVYAPAPWLYTNLIYQGIVEPSRIDVIGGGFSLAFNVGPSPSGVDAWSRIGVDTIFLSARSQDTEDWDWEWRIIPTVRAKIGDSIAQLGIGPRIVGSGSDSLFATIALTYDADNLVNTLLTPPAMASK